MAHRALESQAGLWANLGQTPWPLEPRAALSPTVTGLPGHGEVPALAVGLSFVRWEFSESLHQWLPTWPSTGPDLLWCKQAALCSEAWTCFCAADIAERCLGPTPIDTPCDSLLLPGPPAPRTLRALQLGGWDGAWCLSSRESSPSGGLSEQQPSASTLLFPEAAADLGKSCWGARASWDPGHPHPGTEVRGRGYRSRVNFLG